MKRCFKCGDNKETTAFTTNRHHKDGLSSECRECHSLYMKAHYARNKSYYVDKAKRRHAKELVPITELLDKLKDKPCKDCGSSFPPCAMDFDHVRGVKIDNVSSMRSKGMSDKAIALEVAKCEVVCSCCHRIRTHNRRTKVAPACGSR